MQTMLTILTMFSVLFFIGMNWYGWRGECYLSYGGDGQGGCGGGGQPIDSQSINTSA